MYQLMKMNSYKLLRDRTMWTMLVIFFLAIIWFNQPRYFYDNFVYTGDSEEIRRSVAVTSQTFSVYINFLSSLSSALASIRVFAISAAYCLVFMNREKRGCSFEKICAVSRSRIPVYLSNLLTMVGSVLLFSAVAALALIILVLWVQPYTIYPPVMEYLIFFACYISFIFVTVTVLYSLYMISRLVIVPVVLVTVVCCAGLLHTLTDPVPILNFIVRVLDIDGHLEYMLTIKDWVKASHFIFTCLGVGVLMIVITSIVISKRDLDWGGKE